MTEFHFQEELPERKLEGEELAKAARKLRDHLSLFYKTPNLENVTVRFESGGVERLIRNKVAGDQQTTELDLRNGEYVSVQVARGPLGVNSIRYVKHDSEFVDLRDTLGVVREVRGVLAKIFQSKS